MENANLEDTQSEELLTLTERLIRFVPNGEESGQPNQDERIKQATVYFYKQMLLQQQKHLAGSASIASSIGDICRICREAGSKENLVEPCGCKGTTRFIHLSCLERWLAESDTNNCELCSHHYETIRTPRYGVMKSVFLWLCNPGRSRETRELIVDTLAFVIFSPMIFLGTYLALVAADNLYTTEEDLQMNPLTAKMVTLGCIGVIGAIDTAYLSWFLLRIQFHSRAWNRWWRRNSVVRVILSNSTPQDEEKEANVCNMSNTDVTFH